MALVLVAIMALGPILTTAQTGGRPAAPIVTEPGVRGPAIVLTDPGTDPAVVAANNAIQTGFVYRNVANGFSANLTDANVAALQRDVSVQSISIDRIVTADAFPTQISRVGGDTSPRTGIGEGGNHPEVGIAIVDSGVGPNADLNIAGGADCTGSGNISDSSDHGTHVAGIAAARDNGDSTIGVAPGARIYSVKVLTGDTGSVSQVICGLDWIAANSSGINVINMSLGLSQGPGPECGWSDTIPLRQAVCDVRDRGIAVVVAAGNLSTNTANYSPASYPEVTSVSAYTDTDGRTGGGGGSCFGADDQFATYSNYGADVMAPGSCITSTAPGGGTVVESGSSMAAPLVAGAIGLYGGLAGITRAQSDPVVGVSGARSSELVLYVGDGSVPGRAGSATATPTRAATATPTRAATATSTRAATATPTRAATGTPTRVATASPTRAATTTPTRVATATPTRAATSTATRAPRSTATVTPTRSTTAIATATRNATATPTRAVTPVVRPTRPPRPTATPLTAARAGVSQADSTPTAQAPVTRRSRSTATPRSAQPTEVVAASAGRDAPTVRATVTATVVGSSPTAALPTETLRPVTATAEPTQAATVTTEATATSEPTATSRPTEQPTELPTATFEPTSTEPPTEVPTEIPTEVPTEVPTEISTETPTEIPTEVPTLVPTETPTIVPVDVTDTSSTGKASLATDGDTLTSWYMDVPAAVAPPEQSPAEPVDASTLAPVDTSDGAGDVPTETSTDIIAGPTVEPEDLALEIDLGGLQTVGGIRWQWAETTYAHGVEIQISDDGETWTTVVWPETFSELPGEWHEAAIGLDARFVRFMFPNSDQLPLVGGLSEVEVLPLLEP